MKGFLKRHCNHELGRETQLALFLYGIRYALSSEYPVYDKNKPVEFIQKVVREQIEIIKKKKQAIEAARQHNSIRFANRLNRAYDFLTYHNVAKVFTQEEVDELNSNRSPHDQLEITKSGLQNFSNCLSSCQVVKHPYPLNHH